MAFFLTHTEQRVYVTNLKELNINLEDIAHHLSSAALCRYGGALPLDKIYTVAEHSMLLARYILATGGSKAMAAAALMHDATEAYLGDLVTGLKAAIPQYKVIETELEGFIFDKYGLDRVYLIDICQLDKRIVLDEIAALTPSKLQHYIDNNLYKKPLNLKEVLPGVRITGHIPLEKIKARFLRMCRALNIKDSIVSDEVLYEKNN